MMLMSGFPVKIEAAGQSGKDLFQWLLEQPQQDLFPFLLSHASPAVQVLAGALCLSWPVILPQFT